MAIASTTASAAPAPDLVSVLVTCSEGRQQRINNAPEMRSATVNFNLGIYVSGAGRPFTRLTSAGRRGVSSNEQVGGTGASLGGGVRSVRVDSRTVVLQAN
jgi:hypothetical protein